MAWYKPHSVLDVVFEGSLLLKGLSAASELVAGLVLLFVSSEQIKTLAVFLTQKELFEDPNDITAQLINSTASGIAGNHTYAVVFLLSHAAMKFAIVYGLLSNKRWAYPFSFVTLALFIGYQTYDMFIKFSVGMLLLTLFDLFIVWLVWREYKKYGAKDTQLQHPGNDVK